MDFVDSVKLVLRRWVVFFGVLVPLGALAFLYVQHTPAKYRATANVAFVGPATRTTSSELKAQPINPLSPTDLSIIVHDTLASASTGQLMQGKGDAGYTVSDPTNNQSPVVSLTATSTAPATALKTVDDLVAIARQQSALSQAGVGAGKAYWNQVVVITGPGPVTRQSAGKVRAAAALGILGLILAIAAAFVADSILSRRSRRKTEGRATTDESGDDQTESQPPRDIRVLSSRNTGEGQRSSDAAR